MCAVKKTEADVIVIAAGMSGISAAVAAAERGASVLVFEKGGTVGGAASMGMGFFAVESHIQKKQLDSLTVDRAFKMMMEYTHWRGDARLIRKLFDQSASTVRWVEDMGVEWLGAFKYFRDSEATWHIPRLPGANRPVERGASIITKALADRARELGVRFMFNTPVSEILRNESRVTGVIAVDPQGNEIEAEGDAVICCTGGFGDNPEMIRSYLGYVHGEDLFSFRIPGLKGEGMKMVWAVGGGKTPVNIEMTYESPGMQGGRTAGEVMRQPNLAVNLDGQRFMNEEILNNTPFAGNAIDRQKKRTAFSILTDEIIDGYKKNGLDYMSYHRAIYDLDNWDAETESSLRGEDLPPPPPPPGGGVMPTMGDVSGKKFFFKAASLEDLATQTGITLRGLEETVAEYNAACEGSGDTLFGKQQRYMKPIRGKAYYAMQFFPSGYGSLGGIRVNDRLQVVTDGGDPIPGLYSAGTDCCGIFGDTYIFYLPGSTMGFAVNSGRMAGYNAADYLDSEDFVE